MRCAVIVVMMTIIMTVMVHMVMHCCTDEAGGKGDGEEAGGGGGSAPTGGLLGVTPLLKQGEVTPEARTAQEVSTPIGCRLGQSLGMFAFL